MRRRRLFLWLAAAAGYVGLGMLLGYLLGDKTNNNPLWIGGLLVLCAAVLLGMFISAQDEPRVQIEPERATSPPEPDSN